MEDGRSGGRYARRVFGFVNDQAILGDNQMMRNGVMIVVMMVGLSACTSVRHIQPGTYLEDNAPSVVWVTYPNNTVVAVADPVVKRDTLRGILQGERVKIPLGEIRSVQAKVKDPMKTGLLLSTLGAVTLTTMYFAFISKAGSNTSDASCGLDHNGDPIQDC